MAREGYEELQRDASLPLMPIYYPENVFVQARKVWHRLLPSCFEQRRGGHGLFHRPNKDVGIRIKEEEHRHRPPLCDNILRWGTETGFDQHHPVLHPDDNLQEEEVHSADQNLPIQNERDQNLREDQDLGEAGQQG